MFFSISQFLKICTCNFIFWLSLFSNLFLTSTQFFLKLFRNLFRFLFNFLRKDFRHHSVNIIFKVVHRNFYYKYLYLVLLFNFFISCSRIFLILSSLIFIFLETFLIAVSIDSLLVIFNALMSP